MKAPLQYDYIIAGAGCAGLSLAVHMIRSGQFADKTILLIDQDPKKANDRTWCFWQKEEGPFESIVYRQWEKLWFHGEAFSQELSIRPYRYKMIRGIDFYAYCLDLIGQQPNFTVRLDKVDHVFSTDITTGIMVGSEAIHCSYVFNSILFQKPEMGEKQYWLLQHFKGWIIEAAEGTFRPDVATLMDFRTDQEAGTAFCYVLPFSSRRALVEYTVFSPRLLQPEQYDEGLRTYIREVMQLESYEVVDVEFGAIPMTNFPFSPRQNSIINIGTAGGQTKGSSGYTFNFIQKHSAALVRQCIRKGAPFLSGGGGRFSFYDSVLLNILDHGSLKGKAIFTDLFKKNNPRQVLKFLDNETSLREEVGIISTLPTLPFMKAAVQQIF